MGNVGKKMILLAVLAVGCAATGLYYSLRPEEAPQIELSRTAIEERRREGEEAAEQGGSRQRRADEKEKEESITVYVNGAVLYPGLYKLPKGARAGEAITAAGGYVAQAKTDRVNIARKLRDGSQVYVPFKKQTRGRQ